MLISALATLRVRSAALAYLAKRKKYRAKASAKNIPCCACCCTHAALAPALALV